MNKQRLLHTMIAIGSLALAGCGGGITPPPPPPTYA